MTLQGAFELQIPASAIGANGYLFTIHWPLAGLDLTDADTITGNIRITENGDPFPISGTLTAVAPDVFTWKLHSSDVMSAGTIEVQFRAEFGTDFVISAPSKWYVYPTLSATLPPPDPSAVSFIRNNGDGTYSFLNADDFRNAIGAGTGDMPLVSSATAGNLVIQAADGTLVDAGFAADVNATAGSVVRRDGDGVIVNEASLDVGVGAIEGRCITNGDGVVGTSNFGQGGVFTTQNGQFDCGFNNSAIARTTGNLVFVGASATANRLAQANEIRAVTWAAAQSLTAPEQTQARANIGAEASGAAAAVQSNLNTHTGDSTIHFTQAAINITPTQAGADPAGSAAAVQGNLTAHIGATGAGVHGAGATGAALLATGTVDAARGAIDIYPVAMPPRIVDHNQFTWTAVNVGGTATNTVNAFFDLRTNAVANSSSRYYANSDNVMLNRSTQTINFSRRIDFSLFYRRTVANAEGVFRAIYGKTIAALYGLAPAGNYCGFEVQNGNPALGFVCVNGVVATTPFTDVITGADNYSIFCTSDNGTVRWFVNGVLVAETLLGPTADTSGTINFEIYNGATAANYRLRFFSQSRGY